MNHARQSTSNPRIIQRVQTLTAWPDNGRIHNGYACVLRKELRCCDHSWCPTPDRPSPRTCDRRRAGSRACPLSPYGACMHCSNLGSLKRFPTIRRARRLGARTESVFRARPDHWRRSAKVADGRASYPRIPLQADLCGCAVRNPDLRSHPESPGCSGRTLSMRPRNPGMPIPGSIASPGEMG